MASPPADSARVLLAVGGLIRREIELDTFLSTLMDQVVASMQADRGTLYLVDPVRQELFSRAAHLPELAQIRLRVGQGVAGTVARTGQRINYPTESGEPELFGDVDRMTGYRTSSLLAVPIADRHGECFGVLQVLNRRGAERFSSEDAEHLTALSKDIGRALEATSLYAELQRAKAQPQAPVSYWFNHIIGESEGMKAAYRIIQKAAPTDATVLIRGESGVGKERFARAVHVNSRRRDQPFVKVDCASLPASLIENELFGHEKGAFTGADQRVAGKFETADGGTVFIDELGELPLSVQGKLLRVLQDRQLERVGGTQTLSVDVRIVTATHRDLAERVAQGLFREDLYYRVKVVEVVLPPLRQRGPEDIERLARHFLEAAARKHRDGKTPLLTPEALARLRAYRWPGNVRELENCMESAVVLADDEISASVLPVPESGRGPSPSEDALLPLAELERVHILCVLERHGGNRSAAAKTLGIGRNTLGRKLKAYGLDP